MLSQRLTVLNVTFAWTQRVLQGTSCIVCPTTSGFESQAKHSMMMSASLPVQVGFWSRQDDAKCQHAACSFTFDWPCSKHGRQNRCRNTTAALSPRRHAARRHAGRKQAACCQHTLSAASHGKRPARACMATDRLRQQLDSKEQGSPAWCGRNQSVRTWHEQPGQGLLRCGDDEQRMRQQRCAFSSLEESATLPALCMRRTVKLRCTVHCWLGACNAF